MYISLSLSLYIYIYTYICICTYTVHVRYVTYRMRELASAYDGNIAQHVSCYSAHDTRQRFIHHHQ